MTRSVHAYRPWLLWCAFMVCGAQAEGWDDFSNNLATDLSPLISLFGEQVTKQFLSESLSPLDNFIFAMAPLGILTAVVAAIRVCGSPSLRAFIGRAQEGDGTVEAELCSSTSRSVSELYNNGGIARVFGRPKILEIVRDPSSNEYYDIDTKHARMDPGLKTPGYDNDKRPFTAGIFTFKEYRSTPKGKGEWVESVTGIRNMLGGRIDQTDVVEQEGTNDAEPPVYNPNLSLNIGIKRQSDWFFWAAASIGFFLQTAVLVFGAIITYRLRWEKNGRLPDPWAFPMAFSGTLLQCTGMFLCARLVEQSTRERKFRKISDGREPEPSTLHWLQPGNQAVGDQIFDAFAYSDSANPLSEYVTSSRTKGPKPTLLVWVAISITMSGFLLQFIGLRAMHSSVAVFQLGAMLVMSIIRAGLRTRRFDEDQNDLGNDIETVQGHELDWQEFQFEPNNSDKLWLIRNGPVEEQRDSTTEGRAIYINSADGATPRTIIGFKSMPVHSTEAAKFIAKVHKEEQGNIREQSTEQQGDRQLPKPCLAVRLFKYRARLARLTSSGFQPSDISVWEDKHVYVRDCARMLKMVIEGSAEVLFSDPNLLKEDWRDTSSLCWAIEVVTELGRTEQSKASPVFMSVQKETDSNGWEADLSELEAALGLWTWSLLRFSSSRRTNTLRRVVAEASQEDRGESVKVDLTIWMEKMKKRPQTEKLEGKQCALPLLGQKSVQAGVKNVLTVPADNALVFACAQDIFMSFLSAAVSILNSLGGQTTPKMGTQGLYLDNDKLSELVRLFCDSDLGSKEDAYLSIVPVLQAKSRLPSVSQCLDTARTTASEARKRGNWKDTENLLQWAWRSSESPVDQKKSALALGEFYRWANLEEDDEYQGQFDPSNWMAEATSNDTITMEILMRCKEVFRSIPAKDRLRVPSILHATSQNLLVDALSLLHRGINTKETDNDGRTSLHWAAIRGWTEVVVGLLEVGAEPDSGDSFQRTALSYASESGYLEVVQALINAGSFPNKEDKAHRTPLSYAAVSGNSSVVQFLIKDVRVACDTTDSQGQSPLHWAAKSNSLTVVADLLQASKFKQDFINAEDNVGKTPLIAALENGKADVARLLISEGASCAAQVEGVPAWQWFIEKGDSRSAGFLLQELNNMLIAQNNLFELAPKNNAVIYIFLQTAGKPSQHMIDSLEHDYFQPEEDLKIAFLNEKWTSCTMKFLENAANEAYDAIASFSEIDQQQLKITERKLTTCAIFSFILVYLSEVKVTEEVVMAAARNKESGKEILSLLIDRRPEEVKVTEEVVMAAAENSWLGKEILSLLLDRRPEEVKFTREVVMAAAGNEGSGKEILSLLLDRRPEEVEVTEEVVMAATGNERFGEEILSLLLDRHPNEVKVTKEVVMTAARNECSSEEACSSC